MKLIKLRKIAARATLGLLAFVFIFSVNSASVAAACTTAGLGPWMPQFTRYSPASYMYLDAKYRYLGRIGGISLDKAATFLADMRDIRGAYFDETTNRIVLVGSKLGPGETPVFNRDDLAVAVRALVFNNAIPAVDIGDPSNPYSNPMPVNYYGGIENTNFGNIIEKADYSLKKYFLGYEPNGQKLTTAVPGYASYIDRFLALNPGVNDAGSYRFWISPEQVTLKRNGTGNSFIFDQVKMQVQFQSYQPSAKTEQAGTQFAQHHTAYYDSFAQENVWYKKTKELAKIVSVVKWLKDNNIATDYEWARNYKPAYVPTATGESFMSIGPIANNGLNWTFGGGVLYDEANTYVGDNGQATSLQTTSENAAPSEQSDHWTFADNGQTYQSVAVSASAFRSVGTYSTQVTDLSIKTVGDLNISFSRSYNSLGNGTNQMGNGWDYMPARLTNIQPGYAVNCAPQGGYVGLYPKKLTFQTQEGQYETFTYNCGTGYTADKTQYNSKLIRNQDGSYMVMLTDQSYFKFNVNASLLMKKDKNNNGIYYQYDNGAPYITRINDDYDRSIMLNRDGAGKITSINDWAGRSVQYGYDGSGNLITVKDPRNNIVTYGYDSKNRLITSTNRQGTVILSNAYNDDNRLTSSTDESGLTHLYSYDEDNRVVTSTDENQRIYKTYYDDDKRILKEVDPLNNYIEYTYGDEPGPLTARDKNGNLTNFEYDERGNQTKIVYPNGKQVITQYNATNFPIQRTDNRYGPIPEVSTLDYDNKGNLTAEHSGGVTKEYTYNSQGGVTGEKDGRGNQKTFIRNMFGHASSISDQLGNTTTYTYDNLGRLTQVTDPSSKSTAYGYDGNNNIVTTTDAVGMTTNSYDADNRLTKIVTPDNKTTEYAYNPGGGHTSTKDAATSLTSYGYDEYANLISRQDALSHTTQLAYDELHRKKESTTPLGKVAKWEYDANGNITRRIDESNRTTNYEYDSLNRLSKIIYPDNSVVTNSYDDRGNITQTTSAAGSHSYSYDNRNRLTGETDPHGATVEYAYDNADNLTKIKYPDNKEVNYAYDGANRPQTVTDWNGKQTSYQYAANGQMTVKNFPNGIKATYGYDQANRLVSLEYTKDQNLITKFDYARNAVGNITKEVENKPQAPSAYVLYDEALRSGWSKNWSWDSTINLANTTTYFAGAKSLSWKPDAAWAGLHIRNTAGTFDISPYTAISFAMKGSQPDQRIVLGLKDANDNDLGQQVDISLYGGPISSTGFKIYTIPLSAFSVSGGQISGLNFIEDSGGAQPKLYIDNLQFTTAKASPISIYEEGLSGGFEDWSWDSTNDFANTVDPHTGSKAINTNFTTGYAGLVIHHWQGFRTNDYGYLSLALKASQNNQATSVQLSNQEGDGIGAEVLLSNYGGYPGSDGYTEYTIPLADLQGVNQTVHGVEIQNHTGVAPVSIKADDIKLIPNETSLSSQESTFTYDSLGRILSAVYSGRSYSYTYDAVGNRLTSMENGLQSTYAYNNDNQLLSKNTRSFTYDDQGNQVTDGAKSLTYDFDNRLKSWIDPATSKVISYVYDGNGHRIGKHVNGTPTYQYANDTSGELSRVLVGTDITNNTQNYFVHGTGMVSQGGNGINDRQYYISDGMGNIKYLTDASGGTLHSYAYDPYGNEVNPGNSSYGFQGQEIDRENNLTFLRARYYDSTTGRFLSKDPVEGNLREPATQHRYIYAGDDPINRSDPSGLWYINIGFGGGVVMPLGPVPLPIGVQIGFQFNSDGVWMYGGGGLSTPGAGGSVTYSSSNPSTGWGAGWSAGAGAAISGNLRPNEVGVAWPPGAFAGGTYTSRIYGSNQCRIMY